MLVRRPCRKGQVSRRGEWRLLALQSAEYRSNTAVPFIRPGLRIVDCSDRALITCPGCWRLRNPANRQALVALGHILALRKVNKAS